MNKYLSQYKATAEVVLKRKRVIERKGERVCRCVVFKRGREKKEEKRVCVCVYM